MIYILSTLVALSILILIHEFGHFFAAKWVGIQVPRFSLGLGSRVAGFRVGETEFVVSAIPLGGYVKMAGMEEDEASAALEGGSDGDPPIDPERTFESRPLWARALVISAGVIMNLLFAWLVFTFLALVYGQALDPTTRVATPDSALTGAAAQVKRIPFGARITHVAGEPVETWDAIQEKLLDAPAGPVELRLANLPAVTLDLPAGEEERVKVVAALDPLHEPVLEVLPGQPAAKAGVRDGDRVLAANGAPIRTWDELVKVIRASAAKPLRLDLARGQERLAVTVVPEAQRERGDDGKRVTVGKIGAGLQLDPVRRRSGPLEAVGTGARATWVTTAYIATVLKQLVTGEISPRNMGGLLAIGEASGESARQGLESFLGFLALFSVNLAVLNLLPIPILDGGHLMFLAIEAVRGRPLSVEARIRLSHVGLIIVVGLMLWANGNDVVRWIERLMGS